MLKPLVYQIVLGDIPPEIQECLDSVKTWADSMEYDYQCETDVPSKYKDRNYRITSEWMRLEKLTERPYLCYVDWDIKILKDIKLDEKILTIPTIDTFLYLADNIEIAKRVLEIANKKYRNIEKNGFGHHVYRSIIGQDYKNYLLNNNHYRHLSWHQKNRDSVRNHHKSLRKIRD